jgi:hypothetical protein
MGKLKTFGHKAFGFAGVNLVVSRLFPAVLLSVLCIRIRTYVLDISDSDLSINKQK